MSNELPQRSHRILLSQLAITGVVLDEDDLTLPDAYVEALYKDQLTPAAQSQAVSPLIEAFFDRVAESKEVPLSRADGATLKMILKIGRGFKQIKPLSDYAYGVKELINHIGYIGAAGQLTSRLEKEFKTIVQLEKHELLHHNETLDDTQVEYVYNYLTVIKMLFDCAKYVGEEVYRPNYSVFRYGLGEATWMRLAEPHMRLLHASQKR